MSIGSDDDGSPLAGSSPTYSGVSHTPFDETDEPSSDSSYGSTPEDTYSSYGSSPEDTYSSYGSSPEDTYSSSPTSAPTKTTNTSRKRNSMYKMGALPRTRCPSGSVNLHSSSSIRHHLTHMFGCMTKAWKPALARQDIDLDTPGTVITSGRGRGACGSYPSAGSNVPYYCPSNSTIYASTSATLHEYSRGRGFDAAGFDSIFAHEYGHHIQNTTGIEDSYWRMASSAPQTKKLGMSRRLELQATCFAGMFMHSVKGSYPIGSSQEAQLVAFNSQVGDWKGPRNHGAPKHNGMWFKQGYTRHKAYQCNTWAASGSETS